MCLDIFFQADSIYLQILQLKYYLTTCSDFLTRSYDIGGVISVMALSSLYVLMTQHGLEYPNFYEKLYALLVPSIFMAKHRAKFFEVIPSDHYCFTKFIQSMRYFIYLLFSVNLNLNM